MEDGYIKENGAFEELVSKKESSLYKLKNQIVSDATFDLKQTQTFGKSIKKPQKPQVKKSSC